MDCCASHRSRTAAPVPQEHHRHRACEYLESGSCKSCSAAYVGEEQQHVGFGSWGSTVRCRCPHHQHLHQQFEHRCVHNEAARAASARTDGPAGAAPSAPKSIRVLRVKMEVAVRDDELRLRVCSVKLCTLSSKSLMHSVVY